MYTASHAQSLSFGCVSNVINVGNRKSRGVRFINRTRLQNIRQQAKDIIDVFLPFIKLKMFLVNVKCGTTKDSFVQNKTLTSFNQLIIRIYLHIFQLYILFLPL
jgi:hypothetical protein